MSQPEMGTGTVEAVRFGIYREEEVHKLSVKLITRPQLLNQVGAPEPGGLYDPALGPIEDNSTICKTCGQRCFHCPGHFGHICLVRLVYHPLLFNILYRILQNTCFYCYHFKASEDTVQSCVAKLNLIKKGNVLGAINLDSEPYEDNSEPVFDEGKHDWTSFQLTEAHAILNDFLKKRSRKCGRCKAKSPVISKPTYGWLRLEGLSDESIRDNFNRVVVNGPVDEDDEKPISEVENADDENALQVASNQRNSTKAGMSAEWSNWKTSRSLLPPEVKEIVRKLWRNEGQLCSLLCDIQQNQLHMEQKSSYMIFFLKTLLVPPPKFRPPTEGGDKVMEHVQTALLLKILESNESLGKQEKDYDHNSVISRWRGLQEAINILFDSKSAAAGKRDMADGICQVLEKKEGMFRQKMMGKRVNFACRSVISPDPYLAVNEIGIPPVFALKLTYPERVTAWNMTSLRDAIVNGPEIHPGATQYADKSSTIRLQPHRRSRIPISRKLPSSRGVLTKPGKTLNHEYEGKVVLRHLRNGDIVLVNRQPTLHKPSIIALKVRVLPGEKTIRFHYANCDSFNADFDGDEISVHFPQDEISRAEAYNIVNADNQYIVPTRGDPKRALIQDHIVGAVLLTKRDTFLTWVEFSELLYASGVCSSSGQSLNGKTCKKVSILDSEAVIRAHPPAIIRPQRLWTGKQVITAILNHVTKGSLPCTVKKRGKIAREYFGKDESKNLGVNNCKRSDQATGKKRKNRNMNDKDSVQIAHSDRNIINDTRKRTIVDPSQSIDEDVVFVYKNELVQGVIDKEQFGKFGLVHIIQEMYGPNAAGILLSVLSRVLTAYLQMHGFTCGVDDILLLQPYDDRRKQLLEACLNSGEEVHLQFIGREKEHLDFHEMQIEIEKAIRRNGESAIALLDGMMRSKLNTLSSAVTKLFPEALVKPFRKNCLSLMTLSGAKGGTFNCQQISLLLGQQELEGKRVPRMVSGKTLPCFPPWDSSARAGGFISDRYLTGLRPQEFYFHCMAGREGLVDTAVKTSRSGYLQRCLIKNLECLRVHYDYTVRDADGSIVQFRYGEDGVDVHLKNYVQEFEALAMNQELIVTKNPLSQIENTCLSTFIEEDNEFPDQLAAKAEKFSNDYAKEKHFGLRRQKDRLKFVKMVRNKYYSSLAQPGEPVGVIAAQSVGEPSTQMTLNTFHHAGRGEMNVTLGIPRLQEILMTASINIKTPTMTCPLLRSKEKDDADRLSAKLKRITVADLIENMEVNIVPFTIKKNDICSIYKLKVKLYDPELYPPHTGITLEDCQETLQSKFVNELESSVDTHLKFLSRISGIKQSEAKDSEEMDGDETVRIPPDDDDDDNGIEGVEDLGVDAEKEQQQAMDEIDYDEESDEEFEKGNRKPVAGNDSEVEPEHGNEVEQEHENSEVEQEHENSEEEMKPDAAETLSRNSSNKQKGNLSARRKSKTDLVIENKVEGLYFEVHLMLADSAPHILLAQLAEKTAKKVYVKTAGKIEQCKVVELLLNESETGGMPMLRNGKESRPALQTAGVDFAAFWDMQDEIDVRYITCNDVNAVLNTYGVEAARATIIKEIFTVFGHYGVTVDMRHLTLIADYMTHTGGYRPMSRSGGIAESVSPLSKMSFEQASRFLVEAASFGEVDNLETPSARLCFGLPAKVGTGCFDLMHHINL